MKFYPWFPHEGIVQLSIPLSGASSTIVYNDSRMSFDIDGDSNLADFILIVGNSEILYIIDGDSFIKLP